MSVYELLSRPDDYKGLTTHGTEDWDVKPHWFRGRPIAHEWEPPHLEIRNNTQGTRLVGDFPEYDGIIPVFSKRAVEALGDILRANGELLPIHTPEGICYAFNLLTVIDALDEDRS